MKEIRCVPQCQTMDYGMDTHSYTHEKQDASSYDVTPLILTISLRSTFPFSALTNMDRDIFERFSEVRDS